MLRASGDLTFLGSGAGFLIGPSGRTLGHRDARPAEGSADVPGVCHERDDRRRARAPNRRGMIAGSDERPLPVRYLISLISTRRFLARFAVVVLGTAGLVFPKPLASSKSFFKPFCDSQRATACARRPERSRLCDADPWSSVCPSIRLERSAAGRSPGISSPSAPQPPRA